VKNKDDKCYVVDEKENIINVFFQKEDLINYLAEIKLEYSEKYRAFIRIDPSAKREKISK